MHSARLSGCLPGLHSPSRSVPKAPPSPRKVSAGRAPVIKTPWWWMALLEPQGIDKRQPRTSQGRRNWRSDSVLGEYIIRTLSLW